MVTIRHCAEDKVKNWVKEIKRDREKRRENVRKEIGQVAKDMAGYFRNKAKDKKYFY